MKLIVFDCDGTIVDSQHMIVASMEQAFAVHGLERPSRQDVLGVIGLSLEDAIGQLLLDPEAHDLDVLGEAYKAAFRELRQDDAHREPLYGGAREVISALSAREDVLLGVATGKSRRGVDVLFERENIGQHFFTIQTADDHPSKPDPSMIHRAMVQAGATANQTIMIGDTTFDMEMAVAAGAGALGVSWGYHPEAALRAAGAHALVDDYRELPACIDGLLETREAAA